MRLWLLVSVLLLHVGCTKQPTEVNKEYVSRLANVKVLAPIRVDIGKLPRPTQNLPQSTVTISLLELNQLMHCTLGQHIAEHNSQLGKVAQPSERVKYNLKFVNLAPECINSLSSTEIKDKLTDALIEKRENISTLFNYMLINESEFQRFTIPSFVHLDHLHSTGKHDYLSALTALSKIKTNINTKSFSEIAPENLTAELQKLRHNDYLRQVITSTRYQITFNTLLSQHLNNLDLPSTLCKNNQASDTAVIMSNIFQKFYINQLQPYQSSLQSELLLLNPIMFTLYEDLPLIADLFNGSNPASLLNQLKQSAVAHVKWWQTFYQTCDLRPY
ncbi:hypothetical protein PALB_28510 [Pseudoalteromonas luteoviolacea B = ATCC 29581]|nr:hypothetical protein PALB_28510 [Pseudoalteromonas luteoviolacea B = ATCC 29581]